MIDKCVKYLQTLNIPFLLKLAQPFLLEARKVYDPIRKTFPPAGKLSTENSKITHINP